MSLPSAGSHDAPCPSHKQCSEHHSPPPAGRSGYCLACCPDLSSSSYPHALFPDFRFLNNISLWEKPLLVPFQVFLVSLCKGILEIVKMSHSAQDRTEQGAESYVAAVFSLWLPPGAPGWSLCSRFVVSLHEGSWTS